MTVRKVEAGPFVAEDRGRRGDREGDVRTCAEPGERHVFQVESGWLRPDPGHDIFCVVEGRWEGVLRCEAILHIDDRVIGVICDETAIFILRTFGSDEAASAEVDQHGSRLLCC